VPARPLVITPTAAAARPRAARVGGVVEQAEKLVRDVGHEGQRLGAGVLEDCLHDLVRVRVRARARVCWGRGTAYSRAGCTTCAVCGCHAARRNPNPNPNPNP